MPLRRLDADRRGEFVLADIQAACSTFESLYTRSIKAFDRDRTASLGQLLFRWGSGVSTFWVARCQAHSAIAPNQARTRAHRSTQRGRASAARPGPHRAPRPRNDEPRRATSHTGARSGASVDGATSKAESWAQRRGSGNSHANQVLVQGSCSYAGRGPIRPSLVPRDVPGKAKHEATDLEAGPGD